MESLHTSQTLYGHDRPCRKGTASKKAVAWMVRWVRCMRDAETKNASGLSVDELKAFIVDESSICSYREEVDSLVSGDLISRSSHILSLDHVLSHGLLVVGGRVKARLYRILCGVYTRGNRHSAIVNAAGQLLLTRRFNNS